MVYKSKEKERAYRKAYYQANAEKLKAYLKAYRQVNAEKLKAWMKAWRQANTEKIKAYRQANAERIKAQQKAYRQANAEKLKAQMKAYRQANAERIRARQKAYYQAHYQANAERKKAYNRTYYQANAERIKAHRQVNAERIKAQQKAYRQANVERIKAYRQANAERMKAYQKVYRQKMKEIVLSHYSGGVPKCACCGEQNMDFLSIDHIEGGGREQTRKLKRGGTSFYRWLRDNGYPSGYRVLCINCNSALGFRGYCPHGVLLNDTKSQLWGGQVQSDEAVYQKKYKQKLRHDVLVHYSGGLPTCSCCGEKHEEFLSIDHINNDGADHRRMIGGRNTIYRWLTNNDFPPGFQVLCMNCNFAKGHNSGGCPHKKSIGPQQFNQPASNPSEPEISSASPLH
jgi:hypothetical protein